MGILLGVLIFVLGMFAGFLVKILVGRLLDYSGTILVTHHEGKIFYSLVLDDYPEKIEFQKKVVFKVEAAERGQDRR